MSYCYYENMSLKLDNTNLFQSFNSFNFGILIEKLDKKGKKHFFLQMKMIKYKKIVTRDQFQGQF